MLGSTYQLQDQLPKLPVPELEATCTKLLATVKPLLSAAEYAATEEKVASFLAGPGPNMHAALLEYAAGVDNYVEEFWSASYLEYTAPVVLNVNPVFVLEDDPTPSRNSQIARAASLTLSAIKFVRALRRERLSCDVAKKTPLCMSQYRRLFSTARVPEFAGDGDTAEYVKDRIETATDARHIVVMCHGQLYYFDVVWADGTSAVTQREISRNLERILADARRAPANERARDAVGLLTTEARDTWARARRRLVNLSASNARVINCIDKALFVLCLDDEPTSDADEIAANLLHGTTRLDPETGEQTGTCINRWYDKLQLIVTASGNAGINFEHSGVDGHTVLRFASDVFTDTIVRFAQTISGPRVRSFIDHASSSRLVVPPPDAAKQEDKQEPGQEQDLEKEKKQQPPARRPETRPRKLELDLDERTRMDIRFAEHRLGDLIQQNDLKSLEFTGYGKLYIVQNAMSPDAFVQVAIQAAYYFMYGCLVNTYESVQTKAFLHGRTEAARAATAPVQEFVKLWHKKGIEGTRKVEALRAALKSHSALTREAAAGQGVDRHLFALKSLFQKQHPGEPLPALFADKAYATLCANTLSTSNCGNPSLRFFGFGPVTPQGFGIGYIIKEDAIHLCVTSKHRQTRRFVDTLESYLCEVQDLLLSLEPECTPRISSSSDVGGDEGGYGFFGDDLTSTVMPADEMPVGRSLSNPSNTPR